MKKWYYSRMLWINAIAIAAIILQSEVGYVLSPALQTAILGFINLVLRLITNEGLTT